MAAVSSGSLDAVEQRHRVDWTADQTIERDFK